MNDAGLAETSIPSIEVCRPQWERSTMIPSSFIRPTTSTPKSESPPSTRSVQPLPRRFWEL